MPGNGGVVYVGQPHFVQTGTGAALRLGVARHVGKEAFEQKLTHVGGS